MGVERHRLGLVETLQGANSMHSHRPLFFIHTFVGEIG